MEDISNAFAFLSRFIMFSFSSVRLSRVRKILNSDYGLRRVCLLSTRLSAWNNSAATGRVFMKIYITVFLLKTC